MGLHVPQLNYNPADFYIQILAIIPSKRDECKMIVEVIFGFLY